MTIFNVLMPVAVVVLAIRHHIRDGRRPWAQSQTRASLRALIILIGSLLLAWVYLDATQCGGFLAETPLDIWTHAC